MPARRRKKVRTPEENDPIKRFAAIQRETAERERSQQEQKRRQREDAANAAHAAAEHSTALATAKRELTAAIDAVRMARDRRSGVAEADTRWRHARARLIELETGEAPPWAASDSTDAAESDGTDAAESDREPSDAGPSDPDESDTIAPS
ncbi:hypothetical protein BH24ACT5_BH24ACT5_26130 [soil metagenome]